MNYKEAQALLQRYNQLQLLEYYDGLNADEREQLLKQIEGLDFSILDGLSFEERRQKIGELSPADALSLKDVEARRGEFYKKGLQAIKSGKVAAVLLAGGQGTRLGSDAPKGTFNIGITRTLTIFECQMNNLLSVAREADFYPHLFVMTSDLNDGATRAFFKEQNYFRYRADRIHFYVQKTAPAVSFEGKILLEEKHKIVLTPNGNGGWYSSLNGSDCGEILEHEGIEWLNVYGVDNVLQRICDPVFVGATIDSGLSCGGKVVKKVSPQEKVGVLCKEDGKPSIVEYFEMPEDNKNEREQSGELKYRYGVILNYLFNVGKLNGVCATRLPYHLSAKKITCIKGGERVVPEEPNGFKLETLAVDMVKLMGSCLGFEVVREREFAPVKNRTGVDSVDSARELLKANGVKL